MMNRFKFCPQCASEQPVQSLLIPFECSQCGYTYYQNSASAVAGIIQLENNILFTKRAKAPGEGKWDLPGGFVDHNESLEAALTREVREELGISIQHWHYLCSGVNEYRFKGVTYYTCDAVFVCTLRSMPSINQDAEEISEFAWFDKSEIPFVDIAFASLRNALIKFVG